VREHIIQLVESNIKVEGLEIIDIPSKQGLFDRNNILKTSTTSWCHTTNAPRK